MHWFARRRALGILFVVVLAGCQTATPRAQPSPELPELRAPGPYAPLVLPGTSGRVGISPTAVWVAPDENDETLMLGSGDYEDVDLCATATFERGQADAIFGIFVRGADKQGVALVVTQSGQYALFPTTDDSPMLCDLQVEMENVGGVHVDSPNALRLVVQGSWVFAFINGQQVGPATSWALPARGTVGIYVSPRARSVCFTDLRVAATTPR